MQVLFITERFPWPLEDGGNLRTFHILESVCQQHNVTLLSHAPLQQAATSIKELENFCRVRVVKAPGLLRTSGQVLARPSRWLQSLFILKNWSQPLFEEARKILDREVYDLVHFNHLDVAAFQTHLDWPPSVFDSHNCISTMAAQIAEDKHRGWQAAIYRRESRKLAAAEKAVCQLSDCVFACSQQDQNAFLNLVPDANVHVVANGVDCSVYQNGKDANEYHAIKNEDAIASVGISERECSHPKPVRRIVFIGAMDYAPNVAGVEWFCRDVFPLIRKQHPGVLFQIVGRDPTEAVRSLEDHKTNSSGERSGIEVTRRVDSTLPYLNTAAVVVVPLLHGGGTRLKILEAFAASRAVVSTSKGAEGIATATCDEILVKNRAEEFASAVNRLLSHPEQARRIGMAARRLAERQYDWRTIGRQVQQLYKSLEISTTGDQ